jgi:hypothetical protein
VISNAALVHPYAKFSTAELDTARVGYDYLREVRFRTR